MACVNHDHSRENGSTSDAKPLVTSALWFTEDMTPDLITHMRLKTILHSSQSEFQALQVVETDSFGKTLVLDGRTQSAIYDEFMYHEALVHPGMLLHPNPKQVFIGGGGELATAREVLKHRSVERCVMVDIDKAVVDVSRKLLPEWGQGAAEDPRVELHYEDAHAFLKNTNDTYDVIIMDIADPIEAGPGARLYHEEFYRYALTKLTPSGVLVTQSGPGALHTHDECFTVIHNTLRAAFQHVAPYTVDIPSFACVWAFNVAFSSEKESSQSLIERPPSVTDAAIAARIKGELRFYDGIAHLGLFGTPKWLRAALAAEKRIMTKDTPVFMY